MSTETPDIPLYSLLKVSIGQEQPGVKYVVASENNEVLLTSTEIITEFENYSGKRRCSAFYIKMMDTMKLQMISFQRPRCGIPKVLVRVNGELVAIIRQHPTVMKPILVINDARGQQMLRIKNIFACLGKYIFDLQNLSKQSIGTINKLCGRQANVQHYIKIIPKESDFKFKVAVLGACFLIDFLCCHNDW